MYCSTHCLAKMLPLKLHREIEEKYLLATLHNIGKNYYKNFHLRGSKRRDLELSQTPCYLQT